MNREKQMIDTQKSLANVLSLSVSLFLAFRMCLFFSFSLLRGQTDTIDRPETRVVNKQSVKHIVREEAASASTDGYLFLESCLMSDFAHD